MVACGGGILATLYWLQIPIDFDYLQAQRRRNILFVEPIICEYNALQDSLVSNTTGVQRKCTTQMSWICRTFLDATLFAEDTNDLLYEKDASISGIPGPE